MNIAEYSIRQKVVTLSITLLILIGGTLSYFKLSRLEDPEFTIKDALVLTEYPGASPQEVAEEISDKIEKAVQQMGQLKRVESYSARGLSIVTVKIKDQYDKYSLPQVWDELRRKVNDVQSQLPSGASTSVVKDDYGDVYGMLFAVTGEGYNDAELKKVAKFLQRELLLCPDVKRIELWGIHNEAIYVEMSREKMAALGISPTRIYRLLAQKNLISSSGKVKAGPEYISLVPTGNISSFDELGDLLISKSGNRIIHLKDIAVLRRAYVDPPDMIMRYNGQPAVGFAISTVLGGNAVTMGNAVLKRLEKIQQELPLGIKIHPVSLQSETVKKSVNNFVLNVAESLIIVIAVLLIFMGLCSGVLIGTGLMVTIAGTLMVMKIFGISMDRVSLGALIIALGMLVDNAIVITEGIMVRIRHGEDKLTAAGAVVKQTQWPLLGATFISILAFAAIGTSRDSTGEYCGSLFYVMFIALGISWITAISLTPLLCYLFFKPKPGESTNHDDAYNAWGFRMYRRSLEFCLRHRGITVGVMTVLLGLAIWGFQFIDKSFFPSSTRAQLMVALWLPQGTHIRDTEKEVDKVERYLQGLSHVNNVVSYIGGGANRFLLTYTPEKDNSAYALLLLSLDNWRQADNLAEKMQKELDELCPGAMVNVRKFRLGPGEGGKIQVRVSGREPKILRSLAEKIENIMRKTPGAKGIRSDWRNRVKILRPVFSENPAERLGITYNDLSNAIAENFSGITIGTFRESDELIRIIARAPAASRDNARNLENVYIWSDNAQKMIPSGQVISRTATVWEDPLVMRRHRLPTITLHCDPAYGSANQLRSKMLPEIAALSLSEGYNLEWGGEYEDTKEAQDGLKAGIPIFVVLMVLTVIVLFNSLRQTLVIWLTVPLTIIGVTAGLLLFRQPFNFMALLGFLSLSGMQIKNAIVLLDEINCRRATSEKSVWKVILDSSVSRIRPVSMAAFTTVLGMLPLLQDAFFVAMAVTIMFGLTFACILTLYVVPVIYTLIFRVSREK